STYLNKKGILLATIINTIAKKNINVTTIKQAKIYIIYLLIIFKQVVVELLPNGCNKAAASLYIIAITVIFTNGNTAILIMMIKPHIQIAFFNNRAPYKTVSDTSVKEHTITGTKLPVINIVVISATPSWIAVAVP